MAEISNKALALLVLAALVVVVAATTVQLNRLNAIGVTGMPTTDDGTVVLSIASNLEIETYNDQLVFGDCTPLGGGAALVINSSNNRSNVQCDITGSEAATFDYIGVRNIGNVNARVNVSTTANPATWITGTGAAFSVFFDESDTDCSDDGALTTAATQLHNGDNFVACTNLTSNGGEIQMYGVITIPSDATSGTNANALITFTASNP